MFLAKNNIYCLSNPPTHQLAFWRWHARAEEKKQKMLPFSKIDLISLPKNAIHEFPCPLGIYPPGFIILQPNSPNHLNS